MAAVSTFIQILLGKLNSVLESEFAAKHKKSASYLEFVCSKLLSINSVVMEAEEKQEFAATMKVWLQKLEDVVYDWDDLADEILYDEARRNLETESQKLTSLPRKLIPSFGKRYGKGMESKIKQIAKAIEFLDDEKRNSDSMTRRYEELRLSDHRLPTTSFLDVTEVVGREEDRRKIVRLLLSGDANLDGIAIAGMGGCGKTTLAQLVFNDEKVSRSFDLKAWINVSFDLDIKKTTREIFEDITAMHIPESYSLDMLQSRLHESLAGKRFLLVLDDVWDEDISKWDALKSLLKSGAKGSKILITTRSEKVAAAMGCSTCYRLSLLSDDECWSLFKQSAFAGMTQSVSIGLEDIGRETVKKCHGLPLAVKAIGGLLRSKRSREEWYHVLDSLLSQTKTNESIYPTLSLSYDHLPAHLKHCFTFCSLFPPGYEFEEEKLVFLWMALGFLLNSRGQSMEEVGAECFEDLLMRSFFMRVGLSHFKMHDLIHDLAEFASGGVYLRLESNRSTFKRTRHLSFVASQNDTLGKLQSIHEAKSLRTFFLINSPSDHGYCQLSPQALEDILARQQRLRVLSLSQFQNAKLPDSIGKLKHLRYLDVSEGALHSLPESLCTLYYLETLLLTNCVKLIILPKGIVKLLHLRHLNIKGTGLQQMPEKMSRLIRLRTLSNFIVGNGLNIKELGALEDLHGTLSISKLQNVSFPSDASGAKLNAKRYLSELQLEWSSNESNPAKDMQVVLENLEPSKELKKLTIQSYGGTEFPSWLGDSSFSNIVFLCLRDCNNCSSLPPLGQLPSLEHLIIERIVTVSSIGHEFYRVDESISKPYRSLKTLTFEGMTQWEQWISLQDEEFPSLQKLYLKNCPKLEGGLPKSLPSLVELRIFDCQLLAAILPRTPDTCKVELNNCDMVRQRSNGDNLSRVSDSEEPSRFPSSVSEISGYQHGGVSDPIPSKKPLQDDSFSSSSSVTFKVSSITKLTDLPPRLSSLKIERCNALESLPTGILDRPFLQRLYIIDCDSLKTFPQLHQPSSLKRLYICNCRNFEFPHHNEMANQFVLLENLYLGSSCDSLMSFPLNSCPKLKTLSLWDCENLESLSMEKGLPNDLKSLEVLEIRDCPNLTSFPKEGLQAPNLTSLVFYNCNNLKSLPRWMQSLKSLQSLHINKCRALEPLPPWCLPSSLNILCISLCDKITPQTSWELSKLPSLGHFEIEGGCQEMLSFPEDGLLPSNLKSLRISSLFNLKSLDKNGLQQLTSLQTLEIKDCNELRSLPEDGLPSSLHHLSIMDCSSLNSKLQKRKGKEWSKIAHIPSIHVGDQVSEDGDISSSTLNLSDVQTIFHPQSKKFDD